MNFEWSWCAHTDLSIVPVYHAGGDVDHGRGSACVGAWVCGHSLYLPLGFAVSLKPCDIRVFLLLIMHLTKAPHKAKPNNSQGV